jgi:hypothetical protein
MVVVANSVLVSVNLGMDVVVLVIDRCSKLARDLDRFLLLELERILRALREKFQGL